MQDVLRTLTGLRQHVGNWPGKTVEKKEGSFTRNGRKYLVADLPGTYSLSANSDEEIITRDYIASGKADVVCILADSSQLERSLSPYHKPKWGSLFRYVFGRTKETFLRSFKVVAIVAFVFWLLSYSSTGDYSNTVLFKFGQVIEPVTRIFGMKWQTFVAFIASSLGKEGALGVLSTIYTGTGSISIGSLQGGGTAANINEILIANISKPEALAFIFALTFNMPCIVALAATYQETHSAKWTAIIASYYTATALILSGIAYHIGLLIW